MKLDTAVINAPDFKNCIFTFNPFNSYSLFTKSFAFFSITWIMKTNEKINYLGTASCAKNATLLRHAKRTANTVLDRTGGIIQ